MRKLMTRVAQVLMLSAAIWCTPSLVMSQSAVFQGIGGANLVTAQVACGTTPTVLAAARSYRSRVVAVNTAATAVYVGGLAVTTSTGLLLNGAVGASVTLETQAAVYCAVATGTVTVTVAEIW